MKKLLTSTILTLALSACSTVDFSDRNDMAAEQGYDISDEIAYANYNQPRTIKTLGKLTVNNLTTVTDINNEGNVFLLKRDKSKYYAETSMFTSDNKDKTFFDETLLNFGVDKKRKGMSMELTLKF